MRKNHILESCQGVYLNGDYSVTADTIVEMLNSGRKEQQKMTGKKVN